jgi:hypothetical protein
MSFGLARIVHREIVFREYDNKPGSPGFPYIPILHTGKFSLGLFSVRDSMNVLVGTDVPTRTASRVGA